MTVVSIIEQRKRETFGAALRTLILERFGTINHFLVATYGVDMNGKAKGSGGLYPVMSGKRWPGQYQAADLKRGLNLTDAEWDDLMNGTISTEEDVKPRKAVARNPLETGRQFSFAIGSDGLVSITLNVSGVPIEKAMALLAHLTSNDIVATGTRVVEASDKIDPC